MSPRDDAAKAIRTAFRNPRELVALLGLERQAKRQNGGVIVLCPAHGERTPSCSVTNGPDGTVRFRCFGCQASGDALRLIALARGIDERAQFRELLETAAELAGMWRELDELRGTEPEERPERPAGPVRAMPAPPAEDKNYPDPEILSDLWDTSSSVETDPDACAELARRGLNASAVAASDLARVIPEDRYLPRWARYQGESWNRTGHRMILRVFDADGAFRSVRAWRLIPSDTPKRLPPAGCKASGLVLANRPGVAMLRSEPVRGPVVVVEGEPDFAARALQTPWVPVIGIGSGSWTESFAARVPFGSEVVVRTHRDKAGDGYALKVLESVRMRAHVYRLSIDESEQGAA